MALRTSVRPISLNRYQYRYRYGVNAPANTDNDTDKFFNPIPIPIIGIGIGLADILLNNKFKEVLQKQNFTEIGEATL